MRPILMKGHERPLTFLKYNRDGDLLFSCAKDHNLTAWFADNSERLGTYRGHNGAIWCCGVSKIDESVLTLKGPQGRINRAVWGPLNKTIISAGEDVVIPIWDSEENYLKSVTTKLVTKSQLHHSQSLPIAHIFLLVPEISLLNFGIPDH